MECDHGGDNKSNNIKERKKEEDPVRMITVEKTNIDNRELIRLIGEKKDARKKTKIWIKQRADHII